MDVNLISDALVVEWDHSVVPYFGDSLALKDGRVIKVRDDLVALVYHRVHDNYFDKLI